MFDERKFRAVLALQGVKLQDVAVLLGINEATLYRKIRRGGDFSREEINKLIKALDIKDPASIFFTEKLA